MAAPFAAEKHIGSMGSRKEKNINLLVIPEHLAHPRAASGIGLTEYEKWVICQVGSSIPDRRPYFVPVISGPRDNYILM